MADDSDSWQSILIPVADHCDFTHVQGLHGRLVAVAPRQARPDGQGEPWRRVRPLQRGPRPHP